MARVLFCVLIAAAVALVLLNFNGAATVDASVHPDSRAVWPTEASRFVPPQTLKSAQPVSIFTAADSPLVNTPSGPILGVVQPTHRYFMGIPYSLPPIGSLRWQKPIAYPNWGPKVLNATVKGPGCPQRCVLPPHTCPTSLSEDCLFLNVYTPLPSAVKPGTQLPVMFFIPGGRFEQGEGASLLYNGAYMANMTQTILVDINYRLGTFGFLTTDTLTGNYAIQDQRLALNWVRDNIASFGGNPNLITMFGQSAGATSTAVHLVSPLSKGLFQRAIMESNPFTLPMKNKEEAKEIARYFVEEIGCVWDREDTDSCLRSKNASDVLASEYTSQANIPWLRPLTLFYPWTPVTGSDELPMNPLQAMQQGDYQPMPIMLGTVAEEALFFIYEASKGNNISALEYTGILLEVFGDAAGEVLYKYPVDPFTTSDTRPLLADMGTPYVFRCTNRLVANGLSKFNAQKQGGGVYYYEFDHVMSFDAWGNYTFCLGHVCHGEELPFVFHSVAPFDNFSKPEEKLSASMTFYWTNFARYGDPNGVEGIETANVNRDPYTPLWLPYLGPAQTQQNYIRFATPPVVSTALDWDICNWWDTIGYQHGV